MLFFIILISVIIGFTVLIMILQSGQDNKMSKARLNNIVKNGFKADHLANLAGGDSSLCMDEEKQKIIWVNDAGSSAVFSFSEISAFEFLRDGVTITKGNRSGAIVGAALAGTVGAIIGSSGKQVATNETSKIEMILTTDSLKTPIFKIVFFNNAHPSYKGSVSAAEEWNGLMTIIQKRNQAVLE